MVEAASARPGTALRSGPRNSRAEGANPPRPDCVNELGAAIEHLYWRSIDRPKVSHWLAAYELVSGTVEPHPASAWKAGDLPLTGLPRELTDKVMDDEFPLSMFYEAFEKKMRDVIASRWLKGSSISSTSGSTANARAMPMRCC